MRRYSASEAIGPAWTHTVDFLWRDRRWATGWKLCLVALIAEMSLGLDWTFWHKNPSSLNTATAGSGAVMAAHIGQGVAMFIGFLTFLVGLVLLYVGSRLQLALYEMVVRRQTIVAPYWHKHGPVTWRWIGAKALIIVLMLVTMVPATLIFGARMGVLSKAGATVAPGQFFAAFLPFMGIMLAIGVVVAFFYWALRDFVMPSLVLENTTLGFAFYRLRLFLAAEPGAIVGYMLLRAVLNFVFGIVCYICLCFTLGILSIPFFVVGFVVGIPLHGSPFAAGALIFVLVAVFGILAFIISIVFFGTMLIFYYAWSAYFLGGRYPLLGDLLEPAPLSPYTPPPSFPAEDNSNGPDLPLNPQPAS